MTCFSAKRKSTAFVDKRLRVRERARIVAHLRECPTCSAYFEEVGSLRSGLKSLPGVHAPVHLDTALRVIASRERQAMEEWHGSQWKRTWERWKFRLRLLFDPITIPATGGVLSSLLLFASLAFAIDSTVQTANYDYEVPLMQLSEISANLVPVELRSKQIVLFMSLDSGGHIRGYAVRDGLNSFTGNTDHLQSNNISLPDLQGILAFAHPTNSDISIQYVPIAFRR